MWIRRGLTLEEAAAAAGVSITSARRWFAEGGGVMPSTVSVLPVGAGRSWRLTLAEREEIAVLWAQKVGVNEIGRRLGRSGSTISRELTRNAQAARRDRYRASSAQCQAEARARRPKPTKLAADPRLRAEVAGRLAQNHSPAQIAARLREDFPDEEQMRVSHETIYRSIYVQGRGELRRELARHLRTGRALRKPRRRAGQRLTRIPDMVNISARPPEVEDRSVPGHWEGDLILGGTASSSAIGTLVERATGFLMLLHLPAGRGPVAVQAAMIDKMSQLPHILRRTLTWDQGIEMRNHAAIAAATELDIYFCDPHSPWQRGSNENTNGLLRQYFPKSSDLSFYGAGYLDTVADEMNNRPRKRLNWRTPAEALDALLSKPSDPPGVALTG
jgi:IS30 family transposase